MSKSYKDRNSQCQFVQKFPLAQFSTPLAEFFALPRCAPYSVRAGITASPLTGQQGNRQQALESIGRSEPTTLARPPKEAGGVKHPLGSLGCAWHMKPRQMTTLSCEIVGVIESDHNQPERARMLSLLLRMRATGLEGAWLLAARALFRSSNNTRAPQA